MFSFLPSPPPPTTYQTLLKPCSSRSPSSLWVCIKCVSHSFHSFLVALLNCNHALSQWLYRYGVCVCVCGWWLVVVEGALRSPGLDEAAPAACWFCNREWGREGGGGVIGTFNAVLPSFVAMCARVCVCPPHSDQFVYPERRSNRNTYTSAQPHSQSLTLYSTILHLSCLPTLFQEKERAPLSLPLLFCIRVCEGRGLPIKRRVKGGSINYH